MRIKMSFKKCMHTTLFKVRSFQETSANGLTVRSQLLYPLQNLECRLHALFGRCVRRTWNSQKWKLMKGLEVQTNYRLFREPCWLRYYHLLKILLFEKQIAPLLPCIASICKEGVNRKPKLWIFEKASVTLTLTTCFIYCKSNQDTWGRRW